MTALSDLALTFCYLSVAVTVLSLFLPQKRTRKIFGFVIGLFVVCSLISSVIHSPFDFEKLEIEDVTLKQTDNEAYNKAVKQAAADNLVASLDELLRSEGIEARDIRLSLKISDKGRIYIEDVVIYISEEDMSRKNDVTRIIQANLSKEPQVYVEKEEVQ